MEEHLVKILSIEPVTHNVKRFRVERPAGYHFNPGQATEVAVNTPALKNERRPFTFTALNDAAYLEFTIKIYRDHDGVTNALGNLQPGDEILIHDVWGAIEYKGEGVFIAGGAGVTPFIAILRQLHKENKLGKNRLIFSNKTEADIILHDEFSRLLGNNFINTLTAETKGGYDHRHIDRDYLKEKIPDFGQHFYVCGPTAFVSSVAEALTSLGAGADAVIFEK